MRVLLFAGLAEALGSREIDVPADWVPAEGGPATVGALDAWLREHHPALRERRFRVAVNQGYAAEGDPVAQGDEVALIPPVSGG